MEVEEILDAVISRGYVRFRVEWKGITRGDPKWYRAEEFGDNRKEVLDFHRKNEGKPRSEQIDQWENDADIRESITVRPTLSINGIRLAGASASWA